jgi:hypothetical protein|tara:strand:+ start:703 stop:813 length:111 start_codon:yes stop_codon:yes gene_type:complete
MPKVGGRVYKSVSTAKKVAKKTGKKMTKVAGKTYSK